jgi:outer membrane immunogenic protein
LKIICAARSQRVPERAGLEYAFMGNWSAKLEYLYLDFGTYTFASPQPSPTAFNWATDVQPREHIVRVGLNYKFY